MDSRTTAGILVAASAAALASGLFLDSIYPLIGGIALGAFAASLAFRTGKDVPRATKVLSALGFVAALAAFSMFRVAMKGLSVDGFQFDLFLRSLRVLALVPMVVLLGNALTTFPFSDAYARAASLGAAALAAVSGGLAWVALGGGEVPTFLRPGGVDAVALAAFALALAAGAWTAWRFRDGAPEAAPVAA